MTHCPTCGFDAPLATCLPCRGREVLREARRAELREHLDRGLTARPRWWRPGDPEWLPVNARTWRDFEGSEGVQESTQAADVAPGTTNGEDASSRQVSEDEQP